MDFPAHPFWDFSLKVYGTSGVPPACLELQERHGIDVNVLLFCCWCGSAGYSAMDDATMRHVVSAVAQWHDSVVRGLRAVRKSMKGGIGGAPADLGESLRRRIAATEIDCEHLEQLILAAEADRWPAPDAAARADSGTVIRENIRCYFKVLDKDVDASDRSQLETIVAAALSACG